MDVEGYDMHGAAIPDYVKETPELQEVMAKLNVKSK